MHPPIQKPQRREAHFWVVFRWFPSSWLGNPAWEAQLPESDLGRAAGTVKGARTSKLNLRSSLQSQRLRHLDTIHRRGKDTAGIAGAFAGGV